MKIIVGLGNPGLRYRNTRHNAGFMVLKTLAARHGIAIKKKGYQGMYGAGRIQREETLLFEPLTYMNLSGEAVTAVCSSRLESYDDLLVVTDDVNIPIGKMRLRGKGSSGGHNGLKSIIDKIGSNFARLRIGVGPEKASGGVETGLIGDMSAYVLSVFSREEKKVLKKVIDKAADCLEDWLAAGAGETIKRYNGADIV
ncbi:MAG: aminoacyl-tRNA hydrolase [Candidatus Omnitrophota bacterium]